MVGDQPALGRIRDVMGRQEVSERASGLALEPALYQEIQLGSRMAATAGLRDEFTCLDFGPRLRSSGSAGDQEKTGGEPRCLCPH